MLVYAHGPDGERYCVEVEAGYTVEDLKREVEKALWGRPRASGMMKVGKVTLGDRCLRDGELCSDVGMTGECVVDFELGLSWEEVEAYTAELQGGKALGDLPREAREDRSVVLAAVRRNGHALRDAAEELKANKEVVMEAVKRNGRALQHASKELKADK
eukprot:Sspe_Gene.83265::Locus_54615_Transcript_1_1_Confidence_1.000_Length_632::g.83265::m.83265